MSSVILTNWTVFYSSDAPGGTSGYKQIRWTGAGSPESATNTVNELYSALMDLFSISSQNDANDTTPMQAITPTVYNIGTIDARDQEAWFIDPDSIKHLTGGSIQTVGWTRVVNADANVGTPGILKVPYSGGTPFVASDIGRAIANGSATGTLLWYDATAGEAWIRPTSCVSTHNWAGPAGTISVTSGTGSVNQNGAATSGERLWANIYTIGSLDSSANVYVAQNYVKLTSWWNAGHMDRLFLVNDGTSSGLIDYGYLTVYAREWGYLYDHFTSDVSAGGRNPIPLATSADINNTTASGTIGALSGIVFTFGAASYDLGNGNGSQPYDVAIDCGGNNLNDFYEYTKYVTRRTYTTTVNGHEGQQYITTGELRINFDGQVDNFAQGLVLTGPTGTGVIVANHDSGTTGTLIVRDIRGTFSDNQAITDSSTGDGVVNGTPTSTLISKTAPFGTFAGGQFFGARGVYIFNMAGGDANNYSLIDSDGDAQSPPNSVAITVNNTAAGDRVSVFRAIDGNTSGNINTSYLTSDNTANVIGDTTFVIDSGTPIPSDTPSSGVLRVVDQPGQLDHRYRYTSWTGLTFTLVTSGIPTGNVDSVSGNATTSFRDDNANLANVVPGDMIRNISDSPTPSWAHVVSVTLVSGTTYDVVHTPLQGGSNNVWAVSDAYRINQLVVNYNNTDTAYVPYIDSTAIGTSTSVSIQFASTRNITTRVRQKGYQPFTDNITELTSSGYTISVTRIADDIAT